MELITKKKSYRWNHMVPRNTTLEIAKTFAIKRAADLQTSGLKLLNESIQECELDTRFATWDDEHPLFKETKSHWDAIQNDPQKALSCILLETNQHVGSIASSFKTFLSLQQPSKEEKLPVVVKVEKERVKKVKDEIKQPEEKTPVKTGRWSREESYGSSENKKELGLLLAAARGNLSAPGEKLWSQRRVVEGINGSPYHYEPYTDYTGSVRSTITQTTISGIEMGNLWPCAKALHALVEFYKLENSHIETVLGLIPDALRHSIKENVDENTRLVKILKGEKIEELPTFQESAKSIAEKLEKAQSLIDDIKEDRAAEKKWLVLEPVTKNLGKPSLKIAMVGPSCKEISRVMNNGFGRHNVVFIDADRPRSIPNTKFDAAVPLPRISHSAWAKVMELCGNPPQLRFEKNGAAVRTANSLHRWLALYDQGLIDI